MAKLELPPITGDLRVQEFGHHTLMYNVWMNMRNLMCVAVSCQERAQAHALFLNAQGVAHMMGKPVQDVQWEEGLAEWLRTYGLQRAEVDTQAAWAMLQNPDLAQEAGKACVVHMGGVYHGLILPRAVVDRWVPHVFQGEAALEENAA